MGRLCSTRPRLKSLANAADGLVRRVNILADKSLLAAFAENEYQVTSKHVQAAIGDSEFGLEASKTTSKKIANVDLGRTCWRWVWRLVTQQVYGRKSMQCPKKINLKLPPQKFCLKRMKGIQNVITVAPIAPEQAGLQTNNGAPSGASNTQDDILIRRLNATTVWLASQAPTTVSIQLMGASSDAQLKSDLEVLSQQIEIDNIYVYRTKVNNLPFLTVLVW